MKPTTDAEREKLSSILHDVPAERTFRINNGHVAHNIYELLHELEKMSDDTFHYHVNKDKNDFGMWISVVLNDHKLATDMLTTIDRDKTIAKVRRRIGSIERMMHAHHEQEYKEKHTPQRKTVDLSSRFDELMKRVTGLFPNRKTEDPVVYQHLNLERVFMELVIAFLLGILVGTVIGILIEHYHLIPSDWF